MNHPASVEGDVILQLYSTVLVEHSATYCSAPITSGKRYIEWLERHNGGAIDVEEAMRSDWENYSNEVIAPNRSHATQVVAELRRQKLLVIDPSSAPHSLGWTQVQWLEFWERVIRMFANQLVVVDGWEYSYGSAHEFWFANCLPLPVLDERLQPLPLSRGVWLVRKACDVMKSKGAPTERMERVLAALTDLEGRFLTGSQPDEVKLPRGAV